VCRRMQANGCCAMCCARNGVQRFCGFRLLRDLELNHRPDTHGHFVAKDKKEACALAVKAGVNIEFPEPDCYLHLVELVRNGVLKEKQARRAGRADGCSGNSSWACSTIPIFFFYIYYLI